ncbi:centromere protein P-like [Glandiceps talaboti]
MEGSSEADLISHVNKSIQDFPVAESGSELDSVTKFIDSITKQMSPQRVDLGHIPNLPLEDSDQTATLSNQDLATLKEQYRQEIDKLTREISMLEDEVQRQEDETLEFKDTELQEIMKRLHDVADLNEVSKESSKVSTCKIVIKLKMTSMFTEIHLTDVTRKVIQRSKRKTKQRQTLWGQSYGLTFQLDFDVQETQVNIKRIDSESSDDITHSKACITRLQVTVDNQIENEMREFIQKVQEEKNLQSFFRGFESCAQCFQYRQKTFEYFKQLYPKVVRLVGGPVSNTLQFIHPTRPGPIFKVQWQTTLTSNNRLVPTIDLFIKVPKELGRLDRKGTLKSAPAKFRHMVKHLGIERAIDTMVQMTCTY